MKQWELENDLAFYIEQSVTHKHVHFQLPKDASLESIFFKPKVVNTLKFSKDILLAADFV